MFYMENDSNVDHIFQISKLHVDHWKHHCNPQRTWSDEIKLDYSGGWIVTGKGENPWRIIYWWTTMNTPMIHRRCCYRNHIAPVSRWQSEYLLWWCKVLYRNWWNKITSNKKAPHEYLSPLQGGKSPWNCCLPYLITNLKKLAARGKWWIDEIRLIA